MGVVGALVHGWDKVYWCDRCISVIKYMGALVHGCDKAADIGPEWYSDVISGMLVV